MGIQIDKSELGNIISDWLFRIVSVALVLCVVGLGFHPFISNNPFSSMKYGILGACFSFGATIFIICHSYYGDRIRLSIAFWFIAGGISFATLHYKNDIADFYAPIFHMASVFCGAMIGVFYGVFLHNIEVINRKN